MINRSTWQSVRDTLIAGDRAKLGPPPTVDELLAYERGELSQQDAARVQQLLIAYPELARAYATPFPEDDAALPDDVIDHQWKAFRTNGSSGARVLQFWRAAAAIAAAAAIVFGAMLWQKQTLPPQPRILSEHVLTPDGSRGLSQHYAITATGDSVLLVVSIIGTTDYETYRLELLRESHDRIWSSEPLRATTRNTFDVEIPSRTLV
ncbi:MAG: hypothetical protein ACRD3J_19175, partial [Thermoanaerobaculia bacterium]